MTHFICHQCFWHISIPNSPSHNEPFRPNLVCQKLNAGQVWNCILLASNTGICWLANRMGIQQPDSLIKTLVFKYIVNCIESSIPYLTCIFWIKDILTILHLLLNLTCTIVYVLFVLNHLFQLLWYELLRWEDIPALLKFIVMLGISLTSNHWNKYIWMECNQFNSFNQNLH